MFGNLTATVPQRNNHPQTGATERSQTPSPALTSDRLLPLLRPPIHLLPSFHSCLLDRLEGSPAISALGVLVDELVVALHLPLLHVLGVLPRLGLQLLLLLLHLLQLLAHPILLLLRRLFVCRLLSLLGRVRGPEARQQRDADVSLLQGSDVVGPIPAHEGVVPLLLEGAEDSLLVFGRHARKDLDVLDYLPRVAVAIRRELQGVAGDAEVEAFVDEPRDLLGLEADRRDVQVASGYGPDELSRPVSLQQQLLLLDPARDPDLLPDVKRRESPVACRHGHVVGAVEEVLDNLGGVSSHLTSKRNKRHEVQIALDDLSRGAVACRLRLLGLTRFRGAQVARGERKDSHPSLRHRPVGAIIVGRLVDEEGGDDLGRALDEREGGRRRTVAIPDGRQDAHPLQLRREVIPVHHLHRHVAALDPLRLGVRRRRLCLGVVLPTYRVDRCQLHGVAHDLVPDLHERMAAGEHNRRLSLGLGRRLRIFLRPHARVPGADADQLVGGESPRLVEEAVFHLARKGDPERLSAEHTGPEQGKHSCVHRHCCLHRKLRWNDAGKDQHATEDQLVLRPLSLLEPLLEDVPASNESKDEEEGKEGQDFLSVCEYLLLRVLDHPDQLALARRESCPHAVADAPTIRSHELHVDPVRFFHVKFLAGSLALGQQRLLHLRRTLSCQRCLVHHHTPAEDEGVAGDREVVASSGKREDVAGEQLLDVEIQPPPLAEHLDRCDRLLHPAQSLHVLDLAEHRAALIHADRKQLEQGVVPVLIQEPKGRAEELEDRDGPKNLLDERVLERGQLNVQRVASVPLLRDGDLVCALIPEVLLVVLQRQPSGHRQLLDLQSGLVYLILLPLEHEEPLSLLANLDDLDRNDVCCPLVGVRRHVREGSRLEALCLSVLDPDPHAEGPALDKPGQSVEDHHDG
eukprot:758473-Hanusia_phi.AAC.2